MNCLSGISHLKEASEVLVDALEEIELADLRQDLTQLGGDFVLRDPLYVVLSEVKLNASLGSSGKIDLARVPSVV